MTEPSTTSAAGTTPVWLFYPNLIGYGRIVLALIAMWLFPTSPVSAMVAYALSAALDAFDGWAARTYDQCSRFGAILDQLTDRMALLSLVMTLCSLYPNWAFSLQFSAVLDIASHWLHLHATDLKGEATHKKSSNPILHLYYTDRRFLGFMCGGNEAFYILLYLRAFYPGWSVFGLFYTTSFLVFLASPIAIVKSAISGVHLVTAAQQVLEIDERQRAERFKKQ